MSEIVEDCWQAPRLPCRLRRARRRRRCCSGRPRPSRSRKPRRCATRCCGLRGRRRLPAAGRRPLADPPPGRAAGRLGHDRRARRAARRASPACADDLVDLSGVDLGGAKVNEAYLEARQARHRRAEIPALDAGDLHHGRQQEGAGVPARRRRHQRAHLRPADRLVEERWPRRPARRSSAFRPARRA